MYELKTKENEASVEKFLSSVPNKKRREDSFTVLELMKQITKMKPKMWGPSIVGFGTYHYKYDSGHEGDMCMLGFSPRKQNLVLYILPGFENYEALMKKLGKYKTGKCCLYINKLEDVDLATLKKLIQEGLKYMSKKYA